MLSRLLKNSQSARILEISGIQNVSDMFCDRLQHVSVRRFLRRLRAVEFFSSLYRMAVLNKRLVVLALWRCLDCGGPADYRLAVLC